MNIDDITSPSSFSIAVDHAGDCLSTTIMGMEGVIEGVRTQETLAQMYASVYTLRFPLVIHPTDLVRIWNEFRERPILLDVLTESVTQWLLILKSQGDYDSVVQHTVDSMSWFNRAQYVDPDYRAGFPTTDQLVTTFKDDPWILYLYYLQQYIYRVNIRKMQRERTGE